MRASDGTLSADVSVTVAITDVEEPDPIDPPLAGVLSSGPGQTRGEDARDDGADPAAREPFAGNEPASLHDVLIDYSPAARLVASILEEVLGSDADGQPEEQPAARFVQPSPVDGPRHDRHPSDPFAEGYTIVVEADAAATAADVGV